MASFFDGSHAWRLFIQESRLKNKKFHYQWIAALVPLIEFVTSTTIKSFWQTWVDGPGISLLMLIKPRSTPSAGIHWSLLQSVKFPFVIPQLPQALLFRCGRIWLKLFIKKFLSLTVPAHDNAPGATENNKLERIVAIPATCCTRKTSNIEIRIHSNHWQ